MMLSNNGNKMLFSNENPLFSISTASSPVNYLGKEK